MIEAENVAQHYNISRNDQDLFARSHRFVATHFNNGDINREIVPLTIKGALFDRDESLKQNLTEARLHRLRPILPNGTVTVGNSCMKNDGAGIALIMEKEMVAMGIKWGMLYRDVLQQVWIQPY